MSTPPDPPAAEPAAPPPTSPPSKSDERGAATSAQTSNTNGQAVPDGSHTVQSALPSHTPESSSVPTENAPVAPPTPPMPASPTGMIAQAAPTSPAPFSANHLPPYALQYAPYVYLQGGESFWPGNVLLHLGHCHPENVRGQVVEIPEDCKGRPVMLSLPNVNDTSVYLSHVSDPRKGAKKIQALTSVVGKPDPKTHKSESICFIIAVDKAKDVGPGTVDVFYFFFYPYNLGNTVLGIHFGNHVGDWEHSMIRFKDGEPQAMHLSAHSDGNSWAWSAFEKKDQRPVIFSARGSHANYPTAGTHRYSGIPLGPADYTSRGHLWDPALNFVSAGYEPSTATFTPHALTLPTTSPFPTQEEVAHVLGFHGHFGNAFAEYRQAKVSRFFKLLGRRAAASSEEAQVTAGHTRSLSLVQKFCCLLWGEGPTGAIDKSLDRTGMNRWGDRPVGECL